MLDLPETPRAGLDVLAAENVTSGVIWRPQPQASMTGEEKDPRTGHS